MGTVDRISISWQTYLNINTHEAQCWDTDHNSQHAWQIPLQSYLLWRMRMRWMEFILANLSSSIFANSSASNYIYCRICLLLFILVKNSKFSREKWTRKIMEAKGKKWYYFIGLSWLRKKGLWFHWLSTTLCWEGGDHIRVCAWQMQWQCDRLVRRQVSILALGGNWWLLLGRHVSDALWCCEGRLQNFEKGPNYCILLVCSFSEFEDCCLRSRPVDPNVVRPFVSQSVAMLKIEE